jgi:hypothetical protein
MELDILKNKPSQTKQIEKIGRKIHKENDFVSKIYDIMSSDVFSEFYDTYIHTHTDVNVMIIFMNTYKVISEQYKQIFRKDISKYEMLYYLKESMSNRFLRKYFIELTTDKRLLSYNNEFKKKIGNMLQDEKHLKKTVPRITDNIELVDT